MSIVNGGSYSCSGQVLYINDLLRYNSTNPYDGSGSGPSYEHTKYKIFSKF
jgi:hypothetical protein